MPSLIGSLFVSLTADFAPFARNMKQSEGVVSTTAAGMRRSLGLTEKSVTGLQRSMNSNIRPYALISAARTFDSTAQRANLLRGALFATTAAFGGLGAALTTNVVSRYLDTYVSLQNQLRAVSDSTADATSKFNALQEVAERSRSSLSAVATLYSRLAKSSPTESTEKLLRRVETINKALKLGGATAQESASAAIQFSQAIQSNRLGGEELRAVLETPLGLELAKGLGVTIGQFRAMSKEGKLTADVLYTALDRISGDIDQKFATSVQTIDQALTIADNKIIAYAGSLNEAYGVTAAMVTIIGAFGNNLETIIPLLAKVGLGLGVLFAGKLAAGFSERRFTSVRDGIRGISAARKEDLRLAREEVAAAAANHQSALQAVKDAEAAAAGNVRELAPRADQKAYARDLAAIQKADARHLDLLEQKAIATTQLGHVYQTVSAGEMKAAQGLADQQLKLNALYAEQARIRREANRASSAVGTIKSGLPSQFASAEEAQKRYNDLQKQSTVIARQVAKDEAALLRQRTTLEKAFNASYAESASQRAGLIVNEKTLVADLAASEANRQRLAGAASKSGGAAFTKGYAEANRALTEATDSATRTESAVQRAGGAMVLASRNATLMARSLGVARAAGVSLVGFLGGPWGVAFTAAIGFMTFLGIRAQETAAKVQAAQQIINDELAKMESSGAPQAANVERTLLQDKLKLETENLNKVLDVLREERDYITQQINLLVASSQDIVSATDTQKIAELSNGFREGTVNVETMRAALIRLGLAKSAVDAILDTMKRTQAEADRAGIAIGAIEARIRALDGKIARVTIDISVRDDGVLGLRGPTSTDQRAIYAEASEAARTRMRIIEEARDRENRKAELLSAAGGRKNAARNTPEAVSLREQELLQQGYVVTREEARKLATEELNLEEKTRLAGKSAGGAAKDYQRFADKLAELKAQSEGAFLSDLDQKTVEFAKSLKNGSDMMRQYIAAINSGDLTKAPKELLQAREALMQIGAADTWRDVIRQYGTGADLADQFAEKQAELNWLVKEGELTAQQAGAAYGDFISQFGQYQWVNDLSSAITNFASSAVTDFENIGDAALSLLEAIGKIVLQATLLGPLENFLKGGLANAATDSGGGILDTLLSVGGSLLGGLGGGGAVDPWLGLRSAGNAGSMGAAAEQAAYAMTVAPGQAAAAAGMAAAGGGNPNRVLLDLSPDLVARVLQEANAGAIKVSKASISSYDSKVLPQSVARVNSDRRAR